MQNASQTELFFFPLLFDCPILTSFTVPEQPRVQKMKIENSRAGLAVMSPAWRCQTRVNEEASDRILAMHSVGRSGPDGSRSRVSLRIDSHSVSEP